MSAAGKSNPLAISGLVVLTLIWSYSWIFMKQVTSYIGAFDFTALRCIFGALVLFIVLLLRGRGMRPTPFKYTLAIALLQTCGMVGLAQWARIKKVPSPPPIISTCFAAAHGRDLLVRALAGKPSSCCTKRSAAGGAAKRIGRRALSRLRDERYGNGQLARAAQILPPRPFITWSRNAPDTV